MRILKASVRLSIHPLVWKRAFYFRPPSITPVTGAEDKSLQSSNIHLLISSRLFKPHVSFLPFF